MGQTWTHLPQLVQESDAPQGSPRSVDDARSGAAAEDVPGVGALDFVADAHAAGAQNAAVVVDAEALVAGIDGKRRKLVAQADVIDAQALGEVLQFAGAVQRRTPRRRDCARPSTARRSACAGARSLGVSVRTFMPSSTGVRQEACSFRWPSTSTMQRRHAPTSLMPPMWQRRGMWMPCSQATREDGLTGEPGDHAAIDFESFDAHAIASCRACAMVQCPAGQRRSRMCASYSCGKYFSVLITGLGAVWPRPHRLVSRSRSQRDLSISRSSSVGLADGHAAQDVVHLDGARAAGNAFAAGFLHAELHEEAGDVHHARGFVHDDQAAGAHDGADARERFVIDRQIQELLGDAAAGGAAGLRGFELAVRECRRRYRRGSSRRVAPMGTSMRPVLAILPARAKTLVPLLPAVPMEENHSPPRSMMVGMLAKVSTLLMRVGAPQSPASGG